MICACLSDAPKSRIGVEDWEEQEAVELKEADDASLAEGDHPVSIITEPVRPVAGS